MDPVGASRSPRSSDDAELDAAWVYRDGDLVGMHDAGREAAAARFAYAHVYASWHFVPRTGSRLLASDVARHLTPAERSALEHRVRAARVVATAQHVEAQSLAADLAAAGVRSVFLKACALRALVPHHRGERVGSDLDLVVDRAQFGRLGEVLTARGYAGVSDLTKDNAFRRARHFELGSFERDILFPETNPEEHAALAAEAPLEQLPIARGGGSTFALIAALDVHGELWQGCPSTELLRDVAVSDGLPLPTLPWLVVVSVAKAYIEGVQRYGSGAHLFFEAAQFAAACGDEEAERVVALLARSNLIVPAFYVLRRAEVCFGIRLAEPLQRLVRDHAEVGRASSPLKDNDWGDPWPRLWGRR